VRHLRDYHEFPDVNTMANEQRRGAVENLVHLRVPVDEAISALKPFPWDSEHELATLGAAEVKVALEKFIDGRVSAEELEIWANGVEGRDDIDFTPHEVIDLITEIANPLLFSPLSTDTASKLLARINSLSNT
jgi:hypothetical protein